jgi:hypothetical protein
MGHASRGIIDIETLISRRGGLSNAASIERAKGASRVSTKLGEFGARASSRSLGLAR